MTIPGRHWVGHIWDDLETEPPGGWDDPELHEKIRKAYEKLEKNADTADPGILSAQREFNRMNEVVYYKKSLIGKFRQEEPLKTLNMYEIFAVYAENPESPVVFRPKEAFSFGMDKDEAVLRSGVYLVIAAARKEPTTEHLDPRYVTIVVRHVAAV